MWEEYSEYRKVFSFLYSKDTGFVTITVSHVSPQIAKKWVDLVVLEINSVVSMRDVVDAKDGIEYLNMQLERTSVAEMRSVFYQLIEEQTKKMTLASVREDYVFKTLELVVIAEEK